jgi:hypothetical protein
MTIEQMRGKLLEWNPSWNVDKFTDEQVAAIYSKERNNIVSAILKAHLQS